MRPTALQGYELLIGRLFSVSDTGPSAEGRASDGTHEDECLDLNSTEKDEVKIGKDRQGRPEPDTDNDFAAFDSAWGWR